MNNQRADARMVRAVLASVATGVVIYLIATRGALPLVTRRLTSEQIDWLRSALMLTRGWCWAASRSSPRFWRRRC